MIFESLIKRGDDFFKSKLFVIALIGISFLVVLALGAAAANPWLGALAFVFVAAAIIIIVCFCMLCYLYSTNAIVFNEQENDAFSDNDA